MAVHTVPSDRLAMFGILLSIRQKPFNGLLVIVVLLALDNNLQTEV